MYFTWKLSPNDCGDSRVIIILNHVDLETTFRSPCFDLKTDVLILHQLTIGPHGPWVSLPQPVIGPVCRVRLTRRRSVADCGHVGFPRGSGVTSSGTLMQAVTSRPSIACSTHHPPASTHGRQQPCMYSNPSISQYHSEATARATQARNVHPRPVLRLVKGMWSLSCLV